ncbi:hypothetical protein COCOBI_05-0360 [Coccomyxa sp. Obi]|nr:hypothetical protein COCOBI_05-0360 [Coccomyxa sp. Obi]
MLGKMGKDARSNPAPDIGHRPWDWAYHCTAIRPWDCAYDPARPPSVWLVVNTDHPRKAAKVEQTLRPAAPHLPIELWHRIASHLSTKEWARASGTCRQLRQLQQEHLNIRARSADGSISALLWLAKQLPGAESVVLDGWPVKSALQDEVAEKIHSTMKAALNVPHSLSKLTVLSVNICTSFLSQPETPGAVFVEIPNE